MPPLVPPSLTADDCTSFLVLPCWESSSRACSSLILSLLHPSPDSRSPPSTNLSFMAIDGSGATLRLRRAILHQLSAALQWSGRDVFRPHPQTPRRALYLEFNSTQNMEKECNAIWLQIKTSNRLLGKSRSLKLLYSDIPFVFHNVRVRVGLVCPLRACIWTLSRIAVYCRFADELLTFCC